MKTLIIMLLGLAGLLLPSAGAYAQGEMCAVVVYTKGRVEVLRAGEKDYKKIKVNDSLFIGDKIKTSRWGRASVVIKSGAEVRLNGNSEFEVSPEGDLKEVIKLSFGQLWTKMLHRLGNVRVKTPTAVCAVRGTEADIEQRKLMTVKVYEGHVDVENAAGKQSLFAGQMTTVSGPGSAPGAAVEMKKSDRGNWQEKISVKDIEKYLEKFKDSAEDQTIKAGVMKDGKEKVIEIELKKKD